jgi:hypothetical protein
LLQACIATAPPCSTHAETRLVVLAVVNGGRTITGSITAFRWWTLIPPQACWQWAARTLAATTGTGSRASSNIVLLDSFGADIAALLLADLFAAISPANIGATIVLAGSDVLTSTQRMASVTCQSAAATVTSCLQRGALSFCCCGTDTNALICTSDPPKTTGTICLECAASVHEVRLWTAFTLPSCSYECHSCVTQQIASASTETFTRWLTKLNYASVSVRAQCLLFLPDPVCYSLALFVEHGFYCFSSTRFRLFQ